jgi:hypothetical protein
LRKERDKEIERYKGEGNMKKMKEGDHLIKGRVKEDVGMECEGSVRKTGSGKGKERGRGSGRERG